MKFLIFALMVTTCASALAEQSVNIVCALALGAHWDRVPQAKQILEIFLGRQTVINELTVAHYRRFGSPANTGDGDPYLILQDAVTPAPPHLSAVGESHWAVSLARPEKVQIIVLGDSNRVSLAENIFNVNTPRKYNEEKGHALELELKASALAGGFTYETWLRPGNGAIKFNSIQSYENVIDAINSLPLDFVAFINMGVHATLL